MVQSAETQEVVEAGAAAVGPVFDVMALAVAGWAAREAATPAVVVIEVADEGEEAIGRGLDLGRKLGDFVATLQWAARLKLRVRSQPPLLVTLSGCDGSGKTAQAERFKQVLDTCELRSKILWARGASSLHSSEI